MQLRNALRIGTALGLLLTFVAGSNLARAEIKDLIRLIPGEANTILVVDVEKVLNSPMAIREHWPQAQMEAYAAKPMVVPPGTARVVLAAQLEPGTLRSIWEVSVMDLGQAPSIEAIARAEGGYLDRIAEKPAAWSPIDAYFVQLDPKVLGVVTPANRQFAARWARQKQTLAGAFAATYLASAASAVDQGAEAALAIDLQDWTSMAKVQWRLRNDPPRCVADKNVDLKAIGAVLTSAKGLTLRVNIGDEATAQGEIEFGSDPTPIGDLAKPLLLEILASAGASIPDLENWNFKIQGQKILASGNLSPEGLRRLFSVVNPPAPLDIASATVAKEAAPKAPMQKQPSDIQLAADEQKVTTVSASQKYYAAVTDILDKLQKQMGVGSKSASLADSSTWMKRDAKRINRLPILNVDPDLVAWGSTVSTRLTEAAQVLSVGQLDTIARTTGIQNANISGSYDSYGNWTGVDVTDNDDVRRQRQQAATEEKSKALSSATEIIKDLAGARQKLRVEMTNRYGVEF